MYGWTLDDLLGQPLTCRTAGYHPRRAGAASGEPGFLAGRGGAVSPILSGGHKLCVTVSIGVAALELLRRAGAAGHEAKALGGNRSERHRHESDRLRHERLDLTRKLGQGLRRAESTLHWWPVVDLLSGRTTGAEARARWNRPVRGRVPPPRRCSFWWLKGAC